MNDREVKILHRLESAKAMLDHQIKSIRQEKTFLDCFEHSIYCIKGMYRKCRGVMD